MPDISAFEADLSLAVRANQLFSVFVFCADGLATLRLWTPTDKWIRVKPFLLEESQVLFIQYRLVIGG